MTRIASFLLCACAVFASPLLAQPTTAPASDPASAQPLFAHLPHREGGPTWTIESVAQSLPEGTAAYFDRTKPIPPIKDPAGALRAALNELRSTEPDRHAFAFRLIGATANQTHDLAATKLLTLMQHHGVGTRADAGAAMRTALDLVRAGDREAAEYVARDSPKSFASIAKPVTSMKRLADLPSPSIVKLSVPILSCDGEHLTVGSGGDKPLSVELASIIEKLKVGRVVTVAGVWEGGKLSALIGEVPEPSFDFRWDLVRRPIRRGEWHLQTVRVTVINKGVQPIKAATLRVQCRLRGGLSRTRTARFTTLGAGASQTVNVNFDTYAFDYGEASGGPEAEVNIEDVDW